MDRKRYTPEQIITMLREAEVLHSQGFKMGFYREWVFIERRGDFKMRDSLGPNYHHAHHHIKHGY